MDSGAQMEFVAERLRGEVARFDITDKSGKGGGGQRTSDVTRATRANWSNRHHAHQRAGRFPHWSRRRPQYRRRRHRRDRGQSQRGTDEALLKTASAPASKTLRASTPMNWTRARYISQTLRTDETADEFARVAIYRMMRPGEPPTEDAVRPCSNACSTTPTPTTCRVSVA